MSVTADGDLEAITEDEERLIERKEMRNAADHIADIGTMMDGLSKREVQILSKPIMYNVM